MCVFAPQREMEFVANGCNICSLITVCAACFPHTQLYIAMSQFNTSNFSELIAFVVCIQEINVLFYYVLFCDLGMSLPIQVKKEKAKDYHFPPQHVFVSLRSS